MVVSGIRLQRRICTRNGELQTKTSTVYIYESKGANIHILCLDISQKHQAMLPSSG